MAERLDEVDLTIAAMVEVLESSLEGVTAPGERALLARALAALHPRAAGRRLDDAVNYVPELSPVLGDFAGVVRDTACSFAAGARMWGAPAWQRTKSISTNAAATAPPLRRFVREFRAESLDAFIIKPELKREPRTVSDLGRLLRDLLTFLGEFDPTGANAMRELMIGRGWQWSFAGEEMFVMVMSDVYPAAHVRHAPTGTFVMLQPSEAFTAHGIGGGKPYGDSLKQRVRSAFESAGRSYPSQSIDRRVEAHLYLLPLEGEPPTAWWEPDGLPDQPVLF